MSKKKHGGEQRRTMVRLIALILCVLMVGSAVVAAIFSTGYAEELNATALEIYVEEDLHGLRVNQVTRYVNRTGVPLSEVLFSLGANALRRSQSAPFEDIDGAYPEGFTPGGADLFLVAVNGAAASWGVQGGQEAFLRVACDLAPGEEAEFSFGYEVLLPQAKGFLGTGDIGWRLSFFYPAPLVYAPSLDQFEAIKESAISSSLYFDQQDFTATVDHPSSYAVVSGGEARVTEGASGRSITHIALPAARAFALALSRRYSVCERAESPVKLSLYSKSRLSAGKALDAAARAADFLAKTFGDLPRARFTLVETDDPGQESCFDGLIFLDTKLFALGKADELEREIAFQMARQIFKLSLGVNPAREAWLSDAVSRYAMLLYYEDAYGYDRYLQELNINSLDALNVALPSSLTVDSYADEFRTREEYLAVIEGRGAAAMHEIRLATGKDVLNAALNEYIKANARGHASIADFAAALNQAAGRELDLFLMETLTRMGEMSGRMMEWYE